jgi:hypothetical protein
LMWNSTGTHLLVHTHVAVDASNKSYYGENHLYYMSVKGDGVMVQLGVLCAGVAERVPSLPHVGQGRWRHGAVGCVVCGGCGASTISTTCRSRAMASWCSWVCCVRGLLRLAQKAHGLCCIDIGYMQGS